jgi:hypothetical protein
MLYFPYGLFRSCIQFYLKNTNSKKKLCLSNSHPFFSHSVSPFPYIIHPSYLLRYSFPSSFSISPRSFLSLSLISLHPFHVLNYLFHLIGHSAPSFFSFCPIPVFSLLVPTSKSPRHFSLFCTLSPSEFPLSYTSYTPCCIWSL